MPGKSHRSPVLAGILVLSMLIGSFLPASAFEADGDPSSARSGATYLLSILPAGATQCVDSSKSNKSATYSFQVKNTGDSSLPYCDLQLYPWPFGSNWSYNFVPSAPFEVGSGEVRTVLLVIYPAADAEAKRYTFQLKGKGTGDTTNSISINLDVRQYAGVLVKAPQPQTADPGETLEFDFELCVLMSVGVL